LTDRATPPTGCASGTFLPQSQTPSIIIQMPPRKGLTLQYCKARSLKKYFTFNSVPVSLLGGRREIFSKLFLQQRIDAQETLFCSHILKVFNCQLLYKWCVKIHCFVFFCEKKTIQKINTAYYMLWQPG
jgi:hypothetical protein